jgi:hypothetical protein
MRRVSSCAAVVVVVVLAVVAATATRASPARADACTAAAAKALVRSFVADYGRGRVAAIDAMWAAEPYFQWYSTRAPGGRLGARAYDRATLAAYFRARVRVHERIVLTALFAGYDPKRNLVNFGGKLVRRADDIHSAATHPFKGAADCRSGGPSLIVWSM